MSYRSAFKAALLQLGFEDGELAYLALTSKPENHVRDRLAWRLTSGGLRVGRECQLLPRGKRHDLVIFTADGDPDAILEAKAMYTFDAERPHHHLLPDLRRDILESRATIPDHEIYGLLICIHVADSVPRRLRPLVSYDSLARVADRAAAIRNITAFLSALGPLEHCELGGGRHFEIGVDVDAWLCGPVQHQG